jgi:hypothetical protein
MVYYEYKTQGIILRDGFGEPEHITVSMISPNPGRDSTVLAEIHVTRVISDRRAKHYRLREYGYTANILNALPGGKEILAALDIEGNNPRHPATGAMRQNDIYIVTDAKIAKSYETTALRDLPMVLRRVANDSMPIVLLNLDSLVITAEQASDARFTKLSDNVWVATE